MNWGKNFMKSPWKAPRRKLTKNPDPYRKLKQKSTEITLSLYPSLKKIINDSEDSLLTAIRIAIAGNIIDFGPGHSFDIEKTVKDVLKQDFAVCNYEAFQRHLDKSKSILYIGDNAGETVFDRLLIEEINKPTTYVVRDSPVINDATYEDAVQAGLDKVATIMSSGSDAPGIIPGLCSKEFLDNLNNSEFVIAKGQGNYEGLSNEKNTIFFLLKTKCQIIADDIGVANGDIILKGINF